MKATFSEAVSRHPVRLFQYTVVLMVLLVLLLDGMDAQLLGLVAPIVIDEWGIDRAQFGWALSAAIFGMALGASIGGWSGDKIGRLNSLFGSAVIFGGATIAASFSHDVPTMTVLRFIGGLGFGAAGPNALALASEWTPHRYRTYIIALLAIGTPGGGTIGAGLTPLLLEGHGWRGTFVIFGAISIAVGVLLLLLVRESPSYLLGKGRTERAHAVARKVISPDIELELDQPEGTAAQNGEHIGVFHASNTRLNWGVFLSFAASTAVVYAISGWATVLLTSRGWDQAQAIGVVFWVGLASVAGALLAGYLARALGSRRVMLGCSATGFVAVIILGAAIGNLSGAPDPAMLWMIYGIACVAGGVVSIGISTIYAIMTLGYPISCRSTGIGVGMMMGRVGGIVMSAIGGWLINLGGLSVLPFFAVLTACTVMISTAAFIIDRHIPPARNTA